MREKRNHATIDPSTIPPSPVINAKHLLEQGERFATETHYKAWKKSRLLYVLLNMIEALRDPAGSAPVGLAAVVAVYWFQAFYRAKSTTDAAENQGFYDLILFGSVMCFTSVIGSGIQKRTGHKEYYDPSHFKNYFDELEHILGAEFSAAEFLNPDPQDGDSCRKFYQFHTQVFEYLIRTDSRAAAYMLSAVTRDFPYFGIRKDRPVVESGNERVEAATEAPQDDMRMRIIKDIYKRHFGLSENASDSDLDGILQFIKERAQAICNHDENQIDSYNKVKLRLDAFRERLLSLSRDFIEIDFAQHVDIEINGLVTGTLQPALDEAIRTDSLDQLDIDRLFALISQALKRAVEHNVRPLNPNEISSGRNQKWLKDIAKYKIDEMLTYWKDVFLTQLRISISHEKTSAPRNTHEMLAELSSPPPIGGHVGANQDALLRGRDTVSQGRAAYLAAFNQALVEAGYEGLVTPFSLGFSDLSAEQPSSSLGEEEKGCCDDLLNLKLLSGQKNVLTSCDDTPHDVSGYFEAENTVRNQARYGQKEVSDEKDNTPLGVGHLSVVLARMQYQAIHQTNKEDPQKVSELATLLRRFVGCVNPLTLDKPGRELETQLCDRAHVLAHLLQKSGHYDDWRHWIACDAIRTDAFLKLDTKQQVWLIFQLLSGPDYAKLVALSILQDSKFIHARFSFSGDTPYNAFMREYIGFMKKYTREKSQPSTVLDARKMLFIEHLTLMTDMSAGRNLNCGKKGLMAEFLHQHARKSDFILTALVDTLSLSSAEKKLLDIQPLLDTEQSQEQDHNKKQLDKLIRLQVYLESQLVGDSANRDIDRLIGSLNTNLDLLGIGKRTIVRKKLSDVRWLIAYYRARIHAGELLLSIESAHPDRRSLVEAFVSSNPDFIMLAFPLDQQEVDIELLGRLLNRIDYTNITPYFHDYLYALLKNIMRDQQPFENGDEQCLFLRAEYRDRMRFCAQVLTSLWRSEADHSIIISKFEDVVKNIFSNEQTREQETGFLLTAILENCVTSNQGSSDASLFNCLMCHYRSKFFTNDSLIIAEFTSAPDWQKRLFVSYLEHYYGGSLNTMQDQYGAAYTLNDVINAYKGAGEFRDDYNLYWQQFRQSCSALHFHWDLWHKKEQRAQGQHIPVLRNLLTLVSHGIEQTSRESIDDAIALLESYIEQHPVENMTSGRREHLPSVEQWRPDQLQRLLVRLYHADTTLINYDKRVSLTARLLGALLSPNQLSQGVFHQFATELLPQIIRQMRGTDDNAGRDHRFINMFVNELPDQDRYLIKSRLMLAYVYWRWQIATSPWQRFTSIFRAAEDHQAIVRNFIEKCNNEQPECRALHTQNYMPQLGIANSRAFLNWFQGCYDDRNALREVFVDSEWEVVGSDSDPETQPLLGCSNT